MDWLLKQPEPKVHRLTSRDIVEVIRFVHQGVTPSSNLILVAVELGRDFRPLRRAYELQCIPAIAFLTYKYPIYMVAKRSPAFIFVGSGGAASKLTIGQSALDFMARLPSVSPIMVQT